MIGGLFSSALLGFLVILYDGSISNVFILVLIVGGISAFFGDLLISYYKRQAGVKDTGTILPGHGGILDRIDSHLVATPVIIIMWYFLEYFQL